MNSKKWRERKNIERERKKRERERGRERERQREREIEKYAQNKSDRKVCNRIEVSNTIMGSFSAAYLDSVPFFS